MTALSALALAKRYWHFAAIGLLALLLGVQTLRLAEEELRSAKWESQYRLAVKDIERLEDAIEGLEREGKRRAQAAQDALQRARAQSKADEVLAKRIEAPRPLSGKCETPSDIMGAGL